MKNQFLFQPNKILKSIYPKAIWSLSRNEKIIYLTFDDGPVEPLTAWVLEQLEIFNAKATFFCVGSNILKYNSLFEKIKQKDHQVANHTMFHSKGWNTSSQAYLQEVEDCQRLINNKLFRPPYGRITRQQYKQLLEKNFEIIMWDVISYDYEKINPNQVLENVISNTKAGSIVLFHDNIKAEDNLRFALPLFLKHFSELGYKFEKINSSY
jgi:peptidoglycan/xylan/chitin deacetylase (PgdA/CDA1 family)